MNVKVTLMALLLLLTITIFNCAEDSSPPDVPKEYGFNNHEEYLVNPSVKNAVSESGIDINEGTDPPVLSGTYSTSGEVTSTSTELSQLEGATINSTITLYNQTASGNIEFRETVGGITVYGSGGYITGLNSKFTIWQESEQSGGEAGLPDDITINVALLASGTKLNDGDLQMSGISIISRVETDNEDYNTDAIKGLWWMYEANCDLQGAAKISTLMDFQYGDIWVGLGLKEKNLFLLTQ